MLSEIVFILLVAVGVSAHAYRAHDARQSVYTKIKLPYQECDMEIRLGLNESYAFNYFPPDQRGVGYGYEYGNGGRECTLHFKALDDCMLKLKTDDYSRGDIDCVEQYLIIGDENQEERVCGFGRPPRRWQASGRELFLTHYQRNGRHTNGMTQPSKIRGRVHCEKGVPGEICPAPTQEFIFSNTAIGDPFLCEHGPCLLTLASNGDKIADCNASTTQNCTLDFQTWHAVVLLNRTCGGSALPPIPTSGPNCLTVDFPCPPANPNCEDLRTPTYNFGARHTSEGFSCGAIGQLCTRRYLFCFTIGRQLPE